MPFASFSFSFSFSFCYFRQSFLPFSEYSCPALHEFESEWPETQELQTSGVCTQGFSGSPKRNCLREGLIRAWSSAIDTPCVSETALEEIREKPLLFVLPFALFIIVLVATIVLVFFVQWTRKDGVVFILQWTFSVTTLAFDIWFLVLVYYGSKTLFGVGLGFLLFWFLSNLVYVAFCTNVFSQENMEWFISSRTPMVPVALMALFDVMVYRLLSSKFMAVSGFVEGSRNDLRQLVESLGLINLVLRDIPFVILQALSIFWLQYTPIIILMGFVFSLLMAVSVLGPEIFQWFRHGGVGKKIESEIFTHDEDGASYTSRLSSKYADFDADDVQDEEFEPIFWGVMIKFASPFVLLSFIPQVLTGLGLPFALSCLRRFQCTIKSRQQSPLLGDNQLEREFTWHGRRGFFLLTMNALSFLAVLVCVLPLLTLGGLAMGAIRLAMMPTKSLYLNDLFFEYRRSLHWLIGHLLWSYFPFFELAPTLRGLPQDFAAPSKIRKILALVWYLVIEVVANWLNLALDIYFAVYLLRLYEDPYLQMREDLHYWMIVAFVAAGNGCVTEAVKLALEVRDLHRDLNAEKFYQHVLCRSPLGNPVHLPWSYNFLKFLSVFLQELVQIVAVTHTASYVGPTSRLWLTKLIFSIFILCLNLSKFVTNFVYGRNVTRLANAVLRVFYFGFVATILLVFTLTVSNDHEFCSLNRSVTFADTLTRLAACNPLEASLNITQLNMNVNVDMVSQNYSGGIGIVENQHSVRIAFANLNYFDDFVLISNNLGEVNFRMPRVQTFGGNAVLYCENNLGNLRLGLPVLTNLTSTSVLIINNNAVAFLQLGSLYFIGGYLAITGNDFAEDSIQLPILTSVGSDGGIFFANNTGFRELFFPALLRLEGQAFIANNDDLESIDFQALEAVYSRLYVLNNPRLATLRLPSISSNFNAHISRNAALAKIDLSALGVLSGVTIISANPSLAEILVPQWTHGTTETQFILSSNPSLVSLNLTTLNCRYTFSVLLENNENLEDVYIKEDSYCDFRIQNHNNPKLSYVYV